MEFETNKILARTAVCQQIGPAGVIGVHKSREVALPGPHSRRHARTPATAFESLRSRLGRCSLARRCSAQHRSRTPGLWRPRTRPEAAPGSAHPLDLRKRHCGNDCGGRPGREDGDVLPVLHSVHVLHALVHDLLRERGAVRVTVGERVGRREMDGGDSQRLPWSP
jgi:hypothetical protein